MNLHLPSLSPELRVHSMDLSLDLSLGFVPKPISLLFPPNTDNHHQSLDTFVQRLEDELRKVQAFKRDLPLCMLLLNDAIARLREQKLKSSQDPPFTFFPLSNQNQCSHNNNNSISWTTHKTKSRIDEEDDRSVPNNNNTFDGDSFGPNKEGSQVPRFSLVTPASELSHSNSKIVCGDNSSGSCSSLLRVELHTHPQPPPHMQQNPRKQRRCWSPELHRRFIHALQQLGGAQVATPKQIRELMQVESLTNDEVKSHLQKYRLHVRRFPVSSVGQANNGSYMGQDECGEKSKGNLSQSGSPQGPLTPLLLGGSVKGLSSPGRNSVDAEDEQSDCRNWKEGVHHQLEHDNHSL
ncbi:hypothetical protein Fmac_002419 [Flemingia macrophylla]|uniref:HTH myb-type domain-containing protein n=1 Tax=Flemingia macrophylla TaxID=520843 RepID=A0ABD1NJW1_9FABA